MKHLHCCTRFVFGRLFFLQNVLLSIIFLTLSTNSLASELEECVFTLKEMNQYFSDSGFKHPVDYKNEWFSYDTGQYFVSDKTHNRIYSYFVGYGRIGALDVKGKASLIDVPFTFPISQAVAMVVDRDSGKWGSIFFHEDKIVSKKMGELNPLPEEFFPTPDVNGKFLIRQYKEGDKKKFKIVTTDTFDTQLIGDLPSSPDFSVEYVESTDNELYVLLRQQVVRVPSFKVLVYSTKTWELLQTHAVALPKTMIGNSEMGAITLDIDHKNIIAVRLVDGFLSTNTLLKLSFVSDNVTEFKLRRGGMGGYIYFKMAPGACKKNYLNTKGVVTIEQ
jgi:hypothetical protein